MCVCRFGYGVLVPWDELVAYREEGLLRCMSVSLFPRCFLTYVLYLPDAERLDTFPSVLRIIVFLF